MSCIKKERIYANSALVLSQDIEEYKLQFMKYNFPGLEVHFASSIAEAANFADKANIVLGDPYLTAELLGKMPNLEWIQSIYAGVEALCKPDSKKDFILTGIKEIFGPLMSEYIFAYILGFERNIFEMRVNQKLKIWDPIPYGNFHDLTIGIAGLGSIGRHIAKTAGHFGMKVLGLRQQSGYIDSVNIIYHTDEINSFVKDLDYLVITLPDTVKTKGLFNKNIFKCMKESSVIINIGRGSVINEIDLIEALKNKTIKSAVLDVFENEPLNEKNLLWDMENVFITPHISAVSFPNQIVNIFYNNYLKFINNKPIDYIIDLSKGY